MARQAMFDGLVYDEYENLLTTSVVGFYAGRTIERVVAPLARRGRITQVDQRDRRRRGRTGDDIAQVARAHHRPAAGVSVVVL